MIDLTPVLRIGPRWGLPAARYCSLFVDAVVSTSLYSANPEQLGGTKMHLLTRKILRISMNKNHALFVGGSRCLKVVPCLFLRALMQWISLTPCLRGRSGFIVAFSMPLPSCSDCKRAARQICLRTVLLARVPCFFLYSSCLVIVCDVRELSHKLRAVSYNIHRERFGCVSAAAFRAAACRCCCEISRKWREAFGGGTERPGIF